MYQVKATNKRGYTQESEPYSHYKDALHYALECKESEQYSVIIITKEGEQEANKCRYFLHRIIK